MDGVPPKAIEKADSSVGIEQVAIRFYPALNSNVQRLFANLPAAKAANFSQCWYKYTELLLGEMVISPTDERNRQNKLIANALADSLIALN